MSLIERIEAFIQNPPAGDFNRLALEAFRQQFAAIPEYRRLCEERRRGPETVTRWSEVPAVPTPAFQSIDFRIAPPQLTFRSSGTTAGADQRSVHHNPYPQLYRRAIAESFPQACLPSGKSCPILRLVPPWEQMRDSSLAYMGHTVEERYGVPGQGCVAFGEQGLDIDQAEAWVAQLSGENREKQQEVAGPVLVFATAFALAWWLDWRESREQASPPLPPGSVIFETGGFKGKTREVPRRELLRRIDRSLGVPPSRVVREYGMTELSSQFYTNALGGGDQDLFFSPPWAPVRILDPQDLQELPAGQEGLVAVFDLANAGSISAILTQDLGLREGDGFRLVGRATGAQLRGCSLTVEEMSTGR
ncbi:MAG: hypothetical protein AAGD01_12735 [Acidobacteriota bacterium]